MKNSISPLKTGLRLCAAGSATARRRRALLVLLLTAAAFMVAPTFASAASTYTVEDCGNLGNTDAFTYFRSDMGFVANSTGCGTGGTGLVLAPNGQTPNVALGDRSQWEFSAPAGELITGLGTLGGSYHSADGWISGWALNGNSGKDPLPATDACTAQNQMNSCSATSSGWVSVPGANDVEVMIRCDATSTATNTYCKDSTSEVGAEVGTLVVGLSDPQDPSITAGGTLWNAAQGNGLTNGWISGINSPSSLYMNFSASNPAGICRLQAALVSYDGTVVDSDTERAVSPTTDPALGSQFGTSAPFGSALPCGPDSTGTATFAPDLSKLPTGVYYLNVEAADPGQYQNGASTFALGTSMATGYPLAIDNSVPTVSISTDTIAGHWYQGPQTVTVTANDAAGSSGLQSVTCADQGTVKTYALSGDHASVAIDLSANGQDTIDCFATSLAGNVSLAASATVNIDNQPPQMQLSSDSSQVVWYRTSQRVNAFAAAVGGTDMQSIDCTLGSATKVYPAADAAAIESVEITVNAPGGELACQAVDGVGNRSAFARWDFRIDDTPPTGVFEPRSAADPTRVALHVADTGSGVRTVQIQIHTPHGWWNLPTSLNRSTGIASASIPDDGSIPDGSYAVRALVHDRAGNSTDVTVNRSGSHETVRLPLRALTRLRATVGTGHRHVVAASAGRAHVLKLRHGAKVRVAGVLRTRAGAPVRRAWISITQHVPGRSGFRTVGHVRTNATGRFRFIAPAGPSRTLRLRYAGSKRMRGSEASGSVRVKGRVRLRIRRVIHAGSRTTIKGRVVGGYIPSHGALVQLWYAVQGQNHGWEPFEHAIHTRRNGRFRITFRVPKAAAHLTYRFKAVVTAQAGWPYLAAASKVQMRGIV